jgi:hypothetical protein
VGPCAGQRSSMSRSHFAVMEREYNRFCAMHGEGYKWVGVNTKWKG